VDVVLDGHLSDAPHAPLAYDLVVLIGRRQQDVRFRAVETFVIGADRQFEVGPARFVKLVYRDETRARFAGVPPDHQRHVWSDLLGMVADLPLVGNVRPQGIGLAELLLGRR
jgi:hypothetical protein